MTTAIKLDTARYEVFYNRMLHSVDDAKEVLRYLSGSHITREAGEVMVAFYLPTGEAVSIACGILMHLMNVTRIIRYMEVNNYAEDIGIYDGDAFYNNDPYIGGMHVPDASLLSPVFYKEKLVGYVAAITHTTETGAIDTAGSSPRATEFCHDGIHFPVVKIIERGKPKRDVYNILVRAVRAPVGMQIDLSARIAALERAKLGIKEVIDDFGVEFFEAATRQLADDAVKETRAKFKQFRPGIYRHRCYCDTAGVVVGDKLAIIEVQLEFTEEGELFVKVPVTSPQARCFNNCYTPAIEATVFYTLLVHVLYDTRWNYDINVVHQSTPNSKLMRLYYYHCVQ